MKRIEFIGVAGTGKSSIITLVDFDSSLCVKYDEMRNFLIERQIKNPDRWYLKALAKFGNERACSVVSRYVIKKKKTSFLDSYHALERLTISRFPNLKPSNIKSNAFFKHFFWLLQAEEARVEHLPVLDEGLLGAVENDANTIKELSQSLLGLVHVDTDAHTLRTSLLGRMKEGNKKGPKNLPSLPENEAVDILEKALEKNRRKARLTETFGVPTLTVNYHKEPRRTVNRVEEFISTVAHKHTIRSIY